VIYDDGIMRTIVDLPSAQVDALAELCKAENISRAEAVRRALAEMLARRQSRDRASAFGAWKKRGDSREMVAKLRREWDR